MRMKLPLIRSLVVAPSRAPILRYGVAILSTVLALIPTIFFSDIAESRLVVFAVAVMVSAWYGGWKPGLVATSFALTVSAYYSLNGEQAPREYHRAVAHLALFFAVALLICWFNAALRATQESLRRSEMNFRSLVTNAPYGICRCNAAGQLLDVNPALLKMLGYSSTQELVGKHLGDLYADTHRQVDRLLLSRVLEYTGGNQHQAARLLGIARQTLRIKLRDLGLHVTHAVEGGEDDEP